MWRAGKRMRQHIHDAIDRSVERAGSFAWLGVFAFTVVMITREGMETAVLFNAIIFQVKSSQVLARRDRGLRRSGAAWLWRGRGGATASTSASSYR